MAKQHNTNLDILRGVAALVVVLHHLVSYSSGFDRKYSLGPVLNYNFPAHLCVIVFFILSGYVIGLNHPTMSNKAEISSYIRKRLIRILPIYFIAVLFTVLIWGRNYSLFTIFSNLFFISVPLDNVIIEDSPLWSLNYELIYYFLFIFFCYFKINLSKTLKALLIIIAIVFLFFHNVKIYPLLISYFIGFIFWIAGAMIAKNNWPEWKVSHSRMVSIFMLIFCLQPFNPYGPIIKVLKIPTVDYSSYSFFQQSISYNDLFFFPLTLLLIFSLNRFHSRYNKLLFYFTIVLSVFRLLMLFYTYGWNYVIKEHYVAPSIILISSILLWIFNFQFINKVKKAIKSTAALSKVSYALYVIHLPILLCFGMIQATSWFYFVVKIIVALVTLFIVSYLLEDKFQPYIKRLLLKRKASAING
jgi:peptidoglycan/LPS O-acetylase OafA/YrhL